MGSWPSGMEDGFAGLNHSETDMRSCSSYDEEAGSYSAEVSGETATQSSDFGHDAVETKVPSSDGLPEVPNPGDERTRRKDTAEKDGLRRTSALDILRRNFGTSRHLSNFSDRQTEDSKASENTDSGPTEERAEAHGTRLRGETIPSISSEHEEDGSTITELDVPSDYEGYYDCRSPPEGLAPQLKEHVYCTVYCIANDNYRKPVGQLTTDENNRATAPSTSNASALSRSSSQRIELEPAQYPEPYTLTHLVDPTALARLHSEESSTTVLTCRICLDDRHIKPLHCCQKAVCEECLKRYISYQVRRGKADITCPITECRGYLEEGLVVAHLAREEVAKYRYFLELSRLDSSTKPCPHCALFTSLGPRGPAHTPTASEHKYKVQCGKCQFVWCFKCHAPWHEGLRCRDYRRGDKLLRHWASVIEHGQRNAQKCPRCKIHIQRTEGCDHMTCTQCSTSFCYRCGERYRHLRFFGDHTSNLSVFGCKYRYLPEKPHLRRLVRGSICVSKVLVAPVVLVLVVVVGAVALVVGLFVFPIYYVCKKRKKNTQGSGRWFC